MKHSWVIAFVVLGSCLTAKAQTGDTAQELIALERSFNQALLRADSKAVERIHADDLVFTNADGSVTNKADLIGSIQSGDLKFDSIEMSDVKVQDLGSVAVVTGRVVETGRFKTNDLSGLYRFTDIWAKRNGRWQIVAGHETKGADAVKRNISNNEAEIRALLDRWAQTFGAHDIEGIMSSYAPGDAVVAYDIAPPLQYKGKEAYRKDYLEFLAQYDGPIHVEYLDMRIVSGGDLAFVHALERFTGKLKNGQQSDMWLRYTGGLRKMDGKWLIVHDHVSVPTDFESGKAVLDLKP